MCRSMVVPGRWPRAARCYPPPLSLRYLYFLFSSLLFSSLRWQKSSSSRELTPVLFCIESHHIPFVSSGISLLILVLLHFFYIICIRFRLFGTAAICLWLWTTGQSEDGSMALYLPLLSVCVGTCSCTQTEAPVLIKRGISVGFYN